jgi:hypothetical protein
MSIQTQLRGMRHDGIAAVKREMNDCPRYATDEKAECDDDDRF